MAEEDLAAESNKAIVRHYLEEFSRGRLNEAYRRLAPDFHFTSGSHRLNLKAHRDMLGLCLLAFPSLSATVEQMIAEGDTVMTYLTWHGRHRGDWLLNPEVGPVKPTFRCVHVPAVIISRLVDGLITEQCEVRDELGLLEQIGVVARERASVA